MFQWFTNHDSLIITASSLPPHSSVVGGRATLICNITSVGSTPPPGPANLPNVGPSGHRGSQSAAKSLTYQELLDNQKSDPIQLIIWYKDNTTGSPIYSIDARSVDGSLERAAIFSPSKQFDGRLFFDPKTFPISLIIDPVIENDSGQYFCRVVSTKTDTNV